MRCEQLPPSSPSCASVSPFAPIQAELGAPSPDASEPEPQIETFAFKLLCLAGPALPEYQSRAGGCAAPTSSPPDGRWEWGEGSEPQSSCRLGVQQPPWDPRGAPQDLLVPSIAHQLHEQSDGVAVPGAQFVRLLAQLQEAHRGQLRDGS